LFLYVLSVTEDKVPIAAEVNSGNLSYKAWNFDFIERLAAAICVAESALMTDANPEK